MDLYERPYSAQYQMPCAGEYVDAWELTLSKSPYRAQYQRSARGITLSPLLR